MALLVFVVFGFWGFGFFEVFDFCPREARARFFFFARAGLFFLGISRQVQRMTLSTTNYADKRIDLSTTNYADKRIYMTTTNYSSVKLILVVTISQTPPRTNPLL